MQHRKITVKSITDENFQDYKIISMFIAMPRCDFKCFKEIGLEIQSCQNFKTLKMPDLKIEIKRLFERYNSNPITKAIVFGGLEPFLNFEEMFETIEYFRSQNCLDNIVIYTGYYFNEIKDKILKLEKFPNIIVKFGRFIPNAKEKFDPILGITLASDNQYAEIISKQKTNC
jgi:hypothetical protein